MATTLYLRGDTAGVTERATTHLGTNLAVLTGTTYGWESYGLSTSRGAGLETSAANSTLAGPTAGLEIFGSTNPAHWISPPVAADVTISGAVTCNVWAAENNMSANVAINFVLDKIDRTDYSITEIVKSARTTEVAVTTRAVNNFSATPGSGVSLSRGDRLRVRIFGDDAGTMAASFTFNISWGHTAGGADGDSYITLTENLTFETTDPTGTTLYLTNAAASGGINPGSGTEKDAWTSRGDGTNTTTLSASAGWKAPEPFTTEWYTRPLQAFTLGGLVKANVWAKVSSAGNTASLDLAVYVTATDGTSPTLWGRGKISPATVADGGFSSTTSTAYTIYVAGGDVSVTAGQRLKFVLSGDDSSRLPAAATTLTLSYDSSSGGVDGDSYIILPQSVSEYADSLNPAFLDRVYSQAVNRASTY